MNANKLKVIRKTHKLTQQKAADMVGVSGRQWRAWENGECNPTYSAVELFLLKIGYKQL